MNVLEQVLELCDSRHMSDQLRIQQIKSTKSNASWRVLKPKVMPFVLCCLLSGRVADNTLSIVRFFMIRLSKSRLPVRHTIRYM